jgi:hypothetical protein
MQLPANLTLTASSIITATAGTTVASTRQSAPGPGLRYRLWGWSVACSNLASTDLVSIHIQDSATFDDSYALGVVSVPLPAFYQVFPGGIAMATNQAIIIRIFNGGAANRSLRTIVFYTEEAAA